MAKKLFRSTLTLIFGAVVVVNLLLAYAPATSVSAAEAEAEADGTVFTSGGGTIACICSGTGCIGCRELKLD